MVTERAEGAFWQNATEIMENTAMHVRQMFDIMCKRIMFATCSGRVSLKASAMDPTNPCKYKKIVERASVAVCIVDSPSI